MQLILAYHPISELRFGEATRLDGTALVIDRNEMRRHLLEDNRLQSVDIEVSSPGEPCRLGIIYDVIEPRAKEPGGGSDFPGILGPMSLAGRGTTHVLRGAAVTVLDEGSPASVGKVIEMSGPAAEASPYSSLHHVVVIPHAASGLERHAALNALRLASVKAAVYVARSAFDQPAAETEVMDIGGPADSGREGLPRFAYIGQIHSRQRVAEVDEQILYGSNTTGMMPVILHPNEWLDGAVIISHLGGGVETYFYQNHPVVTELIRWHKAGKITFVGTIASVGASDDEDRTLNCVLASEQAKWNLAADGVVLTKYGGGAPHSDMGLTARLCEELGMRTVVQAQAMSRDRQAESALLFNYPEVDAIVATGGVDIHWEVPAVENVIAPNPDVATALSQPQDLAAARVAGVSSQQGASYVRAFSY